MYGCRQHQLANRLNTQILPNVVAGPENNTLTSNSRLVRPFPETTDRSAKGGPRCTRLASICAALKPASYPKLSSPHSLMLGPHLSRSHTNTHERSDRPGSGFAAKSLSCLVNNIIWPALGRQSCELVGPTFALIITAGRWLRKPPMAEKCAGPSPVQSLSSSIHCSREQVCKTAARLSELSVRYSVAHRFERRPSAGRLVSSVSAAGAAACCCNSNHQPTQIQRCMSRFN